LAALEKDYEEVAMEDMSDSDGVIGDEYWPHLSWRKQERKILCLRLSSFFFPPSFYQLAYFFLFQFLLQMFFYYYY
jgi:hypothetical protein